MIHPSSIRSAWSQRLVALKHLFVSGRRRLNKRYGHVLAEMLEKGST